MTAPEVPHADLIKWHQERVRQLRNAGNWREANLHRDAAVALAALGDMVPREQYDDLFRVSKHGIEHYAGIEDELVSTERERDEALAERDALAAQRSQMRALVIDALANADDTHMGWDAEVSATALLDILDTAPAVSLALHDAEVWEQGRRAGGSVAMRRMSDEPGAPDPVNPYRAAANRAEAGLT